MNPPKMTMLTVALALCLAMAACRQDSGTVPTPSVTRAVAPSVSESPTAVASRARSTSRAEIQPTPTTAPTPTPREVQPTPTPTASPVSPTPTPREVVPMPVSVSPTPTPQEVTEVGAQPTPTPTPRTLEIDGGDGGGPCGSWGPSLPPSSTEFGVEYSTQFLEWTPDGRYLLFSDRSTSSERWHSAISIVDGEGSEVRTIVDANPGGSFPYGFYADLSLDGARIVYSSCEYRTSFDYEIATIGIDGTSPERLTRNSHYDHYPVWSPDGTRIAFLANPRAQYFSGSPRDMQLFTMSADGSDVSSALTRVTLKLGLYPPVWSPNGQWLAFIVRDGYSRILYTVWAAGGVSPKRIGETTTLPSWSPDGERLAFTDRAGITLFGPMVQTSPWCGIKGRCLHRSPRCRGRLTGRNCSSSPLPRRKATSLE